MILEKHSKTYVYNGKIKTEKGLNSLRAHWKPIKR